MGRSLKGYECPRTNVAWKVPLHMLGIYLRWREGSEKAHPGKVSVADAKQGPVNQNKRQGLPTGRDRHLRKRGGLQIGDTAAMEKR